MASYHCTVKVGSRGTGGKHADYVQRSGAYQNYKGGEELAHTESINMPGWAAHDPSEFFRQADLHERANGSAYREIEVAIPRELSKEQRVEFIREFVKQEIGTDHPCTWAIHQPPSALTSIEQPHAHIMFSERKLDGIERNPEQFFKRAAAAYKHRTTKEMIQPDAAAKAKGGCPKSDKFAGSPTERKEKLVALRERFASLQNEYLEKHGHADRVTHKSLEAQGIDRQPEKHLGPVAARVEENIVAILRNRGAAQQLEGAESEVKKINLSSSINKQEKQNVRAERQKTRHDQPAAGVAEMRDVFGVNNVHDLGRPENLLQQDAPGDLRPHEAAADPARLHELATARAVAEAKAQAAAQEAARAAQERAQAVSDVKAQARAEEAARAAQERVQAIADAKAQAAAERKAAWIERGQRRRSGTPNRVIRLDQSHQGGRTEYRWAGNGPAAGKVAVIQTGNQLAAAGRYSAPKAAAMAQIAKDNGWQSVKITGDDAFKKMALPEFLARGIAVSNPELQPQVQAWQQAKAQAEQQQRAAELARQQAAAQAKAQAIAEQQAERQAAREQRQAQAAAEQRLADAIAEIKAAAAAKELAPAPAQSKPSAPTARAVDVPARATPTRLDAEDVALFQRTEQSIAIAQQKGPGADVEILASRFRKIDQVERKLTADATPAHRDTQPFDENTALSLQSGRDFDRRRQAINAEAKAAGHTQVPFAVGQSTLISSTFDYGQKSAAEALERHNRTERPLGMFGRETKDTKAWDSQRAELEKRNGEWSKAVAWRDGREAAITDADGATFSARLAEQRKEHNAKVAAAIAKCAPAKERLTEFAKERERLERLADQVLTPAKQKELQLERGRSHGMER